MYEIDGNKIGIFNKYLFKLTAFVLITVFIINSFIGMVSPGWQKWGDNAFYYTDYFVKAKGLQTIDGSIYYFDDAGKMLKGFYQINDNTYYFNEDGHALTGWQDIEDDKYFFTNEGVMLKNIFIEGHLLGSDGKAYKTVFLDIPDTKYLTTNGSHPTDPALDAKVDKILSSIITPDMDSYQRLYAVYNWIVDNIRYSNIHADVSKGFDSEIIDLTNYALDYRVASCYHYAALSQYMLERLGFQALIIKGYGTALVLEGGFYDHYWNMIAYEGQWYHWDTMTARSFKSSDYMLASDKDIYNLTHLWNKNDYPVSK